MSITMSANLSIHTHKHGNQYTALVRRVTEIGVVTLFSATEDTRWKARHKAQMRFNEIIREAA